MLFSPASRRRKNSLEVRFISHKLTIDPKSDRQIPGNFEVESATHGNGACSEVVVGANDVRRAHERPGVEILHGEWLRQEARSIAAPSVAPDNGPPLSTALARGRGNRELPASTTRTASSWRTATSKTGLPDAWR
jgi:hypothetical protein